MVRTELRAERCIIVSRSVTSLDLADATTASQLYELRLARAMSELFNVTIVAFSALKHAVRDKIEISPLASRAVGIVATARMLLSILRQSETGSHVVAFGYSPLMILSLWILKTRGMRVFTVVFDSHQGSAVSKGRIKRALIALYFNCGLYMLNLLNGVFVVTPAARDLIQRRNVQVFLTRIGTPEAMDEFWHESEVESTFRIVYGGALEPYNSILQIIEACRMLNDRYSGHPRFELTICGTGSLRGRVEEASISCEFLEYRGEVSHAAIQEVRSHAHLALNLRDPCSPVVQFSFPSKAVELLSIGMPMLSTRLPGFERLSEFAAVCEDNDVLSVQEALIEIYEDYSTFVEMAKSAPLYVHREFDSRSVALEMKNFILSAHRLNGDIR